jgi:hypothetical protein
VTEIHYVLGTANLTDGHYVFDEVPFCGYSETVSLVGLPSFATHNLSTSDFTVPLNGDLSLIGEYVVTIKSEILVPTDYKKISFTPMSVSYNFSIFVEPCIVTKLIATSISKVEYTIGSGSVTSQQYMFT